MAIISCVPEQPAEETRKGLASSGFECPAPQFPAEVGSAELDLLVRVDYIPLEMIECFELVYGVKVNRTEYSSNEEMYVRVTAGGVRYDLVQPSEAFVPLMVENKYLQELEHGRLPVLANFDPNYLDLEFDPGNRYTIPYQAGTYAMIVNTGAVQAPLHSWADLWNDDYIRRIVVPDDGRVVIGMALAVLGYDVNTTDPDQLNQARDELLELAPNIQFFDSVSPKTSLLSGDVDLGITWSAEAWIAQKEDPAFQYVYPEEGAILWQDNWAILKNAPHTDAAYAWLNYTMQGDLFWIMMREYKNTIPNIAALEYARIKKVKLYEGYMNSFITNVPPEVNRSGHHIRDVGELTTLYNNIWVEIKGE